MLNLPVHVLFAEGYSAGCARGREKTVLTVRKIGLPPRQLLTKDLWAKHGPS